MWQYRWFSEYIALNVDGIVCFGLLDLRINLNENQVCVEMIEIYLAAIAGWETIVLSCAGVQPGLPSNGLF